MRHRLAAQLLGNFLVTEGAPEPVRTQQNAVALLQVHRAGHVVDGLGGRAQAGEEHVAVDALKPRRHIAQLQIGVVARAREQFTSTHHVQARIAAVNPGGTASLHHGNHQGSAGRVHHALVAGIAQDLVVRRQQRGGQELLHVLQRGLGLALEQGGHGLHGDLGCHLAFGVPPHAIGQHKEARLPRVAVAHAVFVLFAATAAADLEYGEFHLGLTPIPVASPTFWTFFLVSDTRVSSCMRIFSATLSLV